MKFNGKKISKKRCREMEAIVVAVNVVSTLCNESVLAFNNEMLFIKYRKARGAR